MTEPNQYFELNPGTELPGKDGIYFVREKGHNKFVPVQIAHDTVVTMAYFREFVDSWLYHCEAVPFVLNDSIEFDKYLSESRECFVRSINIQEWNRKMRTVSESLLIAFDQAQERLRSLTTNTTNK